MTVPYGRESMATISARVRGSFDWGSSESAPCVRMCCCTRPSAACMAADRDTKDAHCLMAPRQSPQPGEYALGLVPLARGVLARGDEVHEPPSARASSRWWSSGAARLLAA
eukprot:1166841-Pleurochrysis_carterae.AAC.1